jgi:hypothetical protein
MGSPLSVLPSIVPQPPSRIFPSHPSGAIPGRARLPLGRGRDCRPFPRNRRRVSARLRRADERRRGPLDYPRRKASSVVRASPAQPGIRRSGVCCDPLSTSILTRSSQDKEDSRRIETPSPMRATSPGSKGCCSGPRHMGKRLAEEIGAEASRAAAPLALHEAREDAEVVDGSPSLVLLPLVEDRVRPIKLEARRPTGILDSDLPLWDLRPDVRSYEGGGS